MNNLDKQKGFTLLELMLVVGILAIIGTIGQDFYFNYLREINLATDKENLKNELRFVREQAIQGASDQNWGVYLLNATDDYYEIFSSPTNYSDPGKIILRTGYLKTGNSFGNPSEGNSLEVSFSRSRATSSSAVISVVNGSASSSIAIMASGKID